MLHLPGSEISFWAMTEPYAIIYFCCLQARLGQITSLGLFEVRLE